MQLEHQGLFLNIDGLGKLLADYCDLIESTETIQGHTIVIYGDTGCGKRFFSTKCIEKATTRNKDIIIIDLYDYFESANYDSDNKLMKLLELIEFDLLDRGAYNELKEKSKSPELFKKILSKILHEKKQLLLIRFPPIEAFEEIRKYRDYLNSPNVISYFITEKESIVEECKVKFENNVAYFECRHLKAGDGKLVIEKLYSCDNSPHFDIEAVEALMSSRPSNKKMTIKELKVICDGASKYAKENGIEVITIRTIAYAMASLGLL